MFSKKISDFYNYFFNAESVLSGKRLPWIDYAKGISIFLVVYHHAFLGLKAAGLTVNTWLINTNMIVYSFRIPMFFMLSGVFIQQGIRKRGLKNYVKYRAKILLYPYLLWAFMEITIGYFLQRYANFPWRAKAYLYVLYDPKLMGPLWYLIGLFNVSVVYAILQTKMKLGGLGHLLLGIILYLLSPALSFNSMLQQFSIFYVYLAIGNLISRIILNHNSNRLFSSFKTFLVLLPFFIISQIYFIHHENMDPFFMGIPDGLFSWSRLLSYDWIAIQYFLIVIIGCMLMANICFALQQVGRLQFLRVIGFHSLYIYLLHMSIVFAVRTIFLYFFHYDNAIVVLSSQIAIACIGAVMIYNLCKHWGLIFLYEFDLDSLKKAIRFPTVSPKLQKL